jgi:hypothetical protein
MTEVQYGEECECGGSRREVEGADVPYVKKRKFRGIDY